MYLLGNHYCQKEDARLGQKKWPVARREKGGVGREPTSSSRCHWEGYDWRVQGEGAREPMGEQSLELEGVWV